MFDNVVAATDDRAMHVTPTKIGRVVGENGGLGIDCCGRYINTTAIAVCVQNGVIGDRRMHDVHRATCILSVDTTAVEFCFVATDRRVGDRGGSVVNVNRTTARTAGIPDQ